jgi:hypothetical protein
MYYKAKRKKRKGKNHSGGINPLKLKISFNNRRVTKHGGYALLEGFFKWIGLDRLLAQVKLRRRERSYRVKDLLRILLDIILLGVERVSNVALLSKDALLAGLRDLPRLPDDSTLFRFLQSFSAAEVEQLEEVTRKLMKKYSKIKGAVEVTLDFDSTLIPLYGQQEGSAIGYNPYKPGRPSYYPKLAFMAETGELLSVKLEPGNVRATSGFLDFYKRAQQKLPRNYVLTAVRGDAAFYKEEFLQTFETDCIFYAIKVRKDPYLKKIISLTDEQEFKALDEDGEIAATMLEHLPRTGRKPRRYVVVRKLKEDAEEQGYLFDEERYCYQVIVTNMEDKSAEEIWRFYNARCNSENSIKEAKQSFHLDKMPSSTFLANEAYLRLVQLAYNLILYFKELMLLKHFARATFRTIRKWLIDVPANIIKRGKNLILNFPKDYLFKTELLHMQRRLWCLTL